MIQFPRSTEKGIRMMEAENKLIFVVDRKDTKEDIKKEVETRFAVKVTKVNTLTSLQGEKRAIVTFSKEHPAIDVATKLGMM